jgi:hypothetical protein
LENRNQLGFPFSLPVSAKGKRVREKEVVMGWV